MNEIIDIILKERKITDLLSSRGIDPVREFPDRWGYLCPIHSGDSAPSFMVYKNEGQQTYHCYGCHSRVDVINLLCALDNISMKEAIKILSRGLDIKVGTITEILIEKALIRYRQSSSSKDVEDMLFEIGSICRNHLNQYDSDEEVEFFEKVFSQIDDRARAGDVKTLVGMRNVLCEKGIPSRVDINRKKMEQRILATVSGKIKYE